MSVSKTTYLLAVLVSACLAAPAWADERDEDAPAS